MAEMSGGHILGSRIKAWLFRSVKAGISFPTSPLIYNVHDFQDSLSSRSSLVTERCRGSACKATSY